MCGPSYRLKHGGVAALLAGVSALALPALPAFAQSPVDSVSGFTEPRKDAQLFLEANELVYDNDNETVSAVGDVRLEYDGIRLVARKIVYDQKSRRLKAYGNVEIVQPDRTRVYADEIDVTDDFRTGFVNALRVVTKEDARFAAESAERVDGEVTTFNQGVYTACEPCRDNPDKAPVWQIKASRIIWNGKTKVIRYENASFEFLGIPLARLPVFEQADPGQKRKTGFLIPRPKYASKLGYGVGVPFFWNMAPNYDLTLEGTYYSKQGFLMEAEFRHRLHNGSYNLKIAGISQQATDEFSARTNDAVNVQRGMIGTKGDFALNSRWNFGWDLLVQSDPNFANTYGITGFTSTRHNTVYLTGLNDRNYFDLRGYKFSIQEATLKTSRSARNPRQPWVLPSFDYSYTLADPVAGGQLDIDVNARANLRDTADSNGVRTAGLDGSNGRLTSELEWKRSFITQGGLVLTPILAARGDALFQNPDTAPAAISATNTAFGQGLFNESSAYRAMVTAGLEVRWPILFSTSSSTHVLEPMAQVFVRPNETLRGEFANEDAQSFVFDATNLFERDKYSGFDRIEGGTRANVGLRYTGSFGDNWSLYGLAGQSFHLSGVNSFAGPDLVNAGAESGLETDRSDYVAMAGLGFGPVTFAARARFDETSFDVRRAEVEAGYSASRFRVAGKYAYIQAQPTYGFTSDRHEGTLSGSVKFAQYWRLSGSVTHDFTTNRIVKDSIALNYDDECFTFTASLTENRQSTTVSKTFGLYLSFRTLGDFGVRSQDVFD